MENVFGFVWGELEGLFLEIAKMEIKRKELIFDFLKMGKARLNSRGIKS